MQDSTDHRPAAANADGKPAKSFLHKTLHLAHHRDGQLAFWMLLALGCGFLAYVARVHEITHDVFHEMSLFREALESGDFPQQDVFAYTPTVSPSVHHEWATGAVLYFSTIGNGLGLTGLSLLKLLMMAGLWLVLYRVARMRGAHPYIFALIAFFCFPVFWVGFATVRAQLFTLLFLAIQLWMQELDWRGRRAWVLGWLIMLVAWLNLHAGFVVGVGLITFHGLERIAYSWFQTRSVMGVLRATWHLIMAAPVAAATLLVNPYGWQYIPYLIRAIGMDRPLIREWLPLWHTHDPIVTIGVFLASLALFAYGVRHNPFRRSRGAAFLALTAYMTLKHIRHGSIYGVVWLAYVPAWISRTALGQNLVQWIEGQRSLVIRVSQAVVCASLLFACYHQFWRPTLPPLPRYSSASYPVEAVNYLQQHGFAGNLMTPFHVGAYVSWEMYPKVHVSFDGRYEVAYQEQVMPEHNRFYDAEPGGWDILDKYPTDAVLIHKQAKVCRYLDLFRNASAHTGPAEPVQESPPLPTQQRWQLVYEDDAYAILVPPESGLPVVDLRGQPLTDAAAEAFSSEHAHWNRLRPQPALASWSPSGSQSVGSPSQEPE